MAPIHYIGVMKHIIAAIALLAASAMPALAGEATASTAPQLDRTQEYRMWSAEKMIERVVTRLGRMNAACTGAFVQTYMPKASETCEKNVMSVYPQLTIIRQIAASGDDVLWARIVDAVHKLEADTEAPLNRAEQK